MNDPARLLSDEEAEQLIESWACGPGVTEHTALEICVAFWRARRAGSRRPIPLKEGAPVPGCTCERCAQLGAKPRRRRRPKQDLRPALDLDAARDVPILDVARRLGLGDGDRRGPETWFRCPLHDDQRPSLRVDPRKRVWFCDPCGEGGDGIRLVMRTLGCSFPDAVKELTGQISDRLRIRLTVCVDR